MNSRFKITIAIAMIFSVLLACNDNKLNINTDHIEVNLKFKRFEEDFYSLKKHTKDPAIFYSELDKLQQNYGAFYNDWVQMPELMGIGNPQSPETKEILRQILLSSRFDQIMKIVQAKFQNFGPVEEEFTQAYKRFKYYFPNDSIPDIVTFISNFSLTMNPVGNGYIGINLDMHLGDTFFVYKALEPPLENYLLKLLVPENIVPLHMMAHGQDLFLETNRGLKFCDDLFYWGKLMYFTQAMNPTTPPYLILGYTKEEWELCEKEKENIWEYFIKNDLLYSSDKKTNNKFFMEGPFTSAPGVPPNTPPMLGKYIGWKMVQSYMNENPSIDLKTLLYKKDAEQFLREFKFKP
jgi:hypothetical protein